jgi:cytochrome P450
MADEFHASGPPLAWSDNHGGFWLLPSWEGIQQVGRDWETFTSVNDLDGSENGGKGQIIPRMPYRLFLGESDPPLHTERRRLEAPFFTPKSLRTMRPVVQRYLLEAVNEVIESGSANLLSDVIIPTTARTTLHLLGYDIGDWRDPAAVTVKTSFMTPDHPDYPHAEQERMRGIFRELLTERAARPTGDIVSALANGSVEGRPMTIEEGESMMNALVFGGFETTTTVTADALIWLDRNPQARERLKAEPRLYSNAIDEFLRVFPPTVHMSRTAIRDTELMGQRIAAGERVMMWLAAGNRDPRKFPDPERIDIGRDNARDQLSFSVGPHRCLGSPLAKIEVQHMLESIPELLPDMAIDHDGIERYPAGGLLLGYHEVPLRFTPGKRLELPDLD